jgi:TolB-like protein/Flp pilus assembly protein TadD
MADTSVPGVSSAPLPPERRLESWGEIATYLRREIRTVQRWERNLGLPVHRLSVGKQSSVFAYPSELDKWFRERESRLKEDKDDDTSTRSPEIPNGTTNPEARGERNPDENAEQRRVRRRALWLSGLAFLIVAGVLVARFTVSVQPRVSVAQGDKLRLFVRPFKTIAGDASQAEFTEGLTSEMITRLGRIEPKHLGVIAPTSSQQLGGKPITELASLLGVNYVLEGTVRRGNDQVRINMTLVSAKDQTPLWSDSFTENITDILKVQNKVADSVAEKLLLSLPPADVASPASVDPAGYDYYLRGRRAWMVRDLAHAVSDYELAVTWLPNYALAHSGLAAAYALLGEAPNDAVPPTESAPKARAEAQRALTLDPSNAEAHYVLGNLAMYFDFDFPAAEREFRRALALEPNNPTAHEWLGQFLAAQNRMAEAQAETLKALELDPVSPIFTTARADAFYYARNFDSTIQQANLTLEQSPNFVLAEFWLASGQREKKLYPAALKHFRAANHLAPYSPALMMALGHALAVSGDRPGALAVLTQLQTLSTKRHVPAIYFAGVYVGLNDKDMAFHFLDKAFKEHDDRLPYLAVEPMADPIRSDPRFHDLLAKLNLR